MTVHSSFLLRCNLHSSSDPASGKAYYIQHVQTGAEFRAATLEDVTRWVADQNFRYLADMISAPPDPTSGEQEDLQ
jgi:hypothetical protein